MAEYIDRFALIDAMQAYQYDAGKDGFAIMALIGIQPTADVAPVVRCRDCKYWQDNNDGYPHEECRWGHGETPNDDDFCSYGARMDGEVE